MAIKKREDEGLPEYFATFADMMTLLMTFFVLLFSMSTLDPVKMADMEAAMQESATGERRERRQIKTQSQIHDEVKEAIEQTQMQDVAEVTHSPKGTSITIGSEFAFESGSADLKPAMYTFLDGIIPIMMDEGNRFPIAVEGHTDNLPIPVAWIEKYPTNWELSAGRAARVVKYCIDKGVPGGKLRAVGFADRIPYGTNWQQTRIGVSNEMVRAQNSTEELRSANRRVEITFLSIG